jgi:Spy/CpxP family protein refolding chaperone
LKHRYAILVLAPLLACGISAAQQVGQWTLNSQVLQPEHPATPERVLQGGRSARWWVNPLVARRLALTPDQQKKMDDVFQQSRLKLIDLSAALDKEEAILEPLVEADQLDAPKIRTQIDRIAQARAELEKANANMLLGIRLILTPEQWHSLGPNGRGMRGGRLLDQSDDSTSQAPAAAPVPKKKQQ